MSLSKPSRTIVVEPVQAAATAPPPVAEEPAREPVPAEAPARP